MTKLEASNSERGRTADSPGDIPRAGWRDILLRVKQQLGDDAVGLVAAGVAFYSMLAVFPGMAALVSIYGLVADPGEIAAQLARLEALPAEARELLGGQLDEIASQANTSLGVAAIAGILGALWSANRGASALVRAINIAYDEEEGRGFLRLTALSFIFTVGAVGVAIVALTVVLGIPAIIKGIGLGEWASVLVSTIPWVVVLLVWFGALTVLYRYGPSRRDARWRWVTPGALLATVLWIGGSIGFSYYVANFGSYNETYGSVGAVVVLQMWFYLCAYVVMLGAELNSELEHQTAEDTTVGGEQPFGERGAYVADDLGAVP